MHKTVVICSRAVLVIQTTRVQRGQAISKSSQSFFF